MSGLVFQVGRNFVLSLKRYTSSYNKQILDKICFDEVEEFNESAAFEGDVPKGIPLERSINDVTLLGRVGRDPALITAMNYKSFARFYLATRSIRVNKERGTDWHEVVCYDDKLKDYIMNSIKQGDRIFIQGTLNYLRPPPELNVPYQKARILVRKILIAKRKSSKDEDLDT